MAICRLLQQRGSRRLSPRHRCPWAQYRPNASQTAILGWWSGGTAGARWVVGAVCAENSRKHPFGHKGGSCAGGRLRLHSSAGQQDGLRECADGLGGWADRLRGSEGPIWGGSYRAQIGCFLKGAKTPLLKIAFKTPLAPPKINENGERAITHGLNVHRIHPQAAN